MNSICVRIAAAVSLVAGLAAFAAAEQHNVPPTSSTAARTLPSPRAGVDSGVQQLPARQILARAKEAAQRAGSVRVVGVVREGNQSVELDVRLQGQQGVGLIRTNGATVRVVKVGSDVYVQGDDTFYEQFGGAEMARLLTGKWLKGSSSHPPLARFANLLSVDKLLDSTLVPEDEVLKRGERLLGDVRAVELRGETTRRLVSVALTGEPYPLSIRPGGKDTGKGHVNFSDWGVPVSVQAPPADSVVEASRLRK